MGRLTRAKRGLLIGRRPWRVSSAPLRARRVGSTQSNMSMPRATHLPEVFGRADAHQVARLVGGQQRRGHLEHGVHQRLGLAHAEAADGVAGEVERGQDARRSRWRRSG